MTITHLAPLNPVHISAVEGNGIESRSEGTAEVSLHGTPPVGAPPSSLHSPLNVQPLNRSRTSQHTPIPPASLAAPMDVAAQMQIAVQAFGMQVRFAVDPDSQQVIVQVYDVTTQEVIREIPPEQIVKVLSKIRDAHDAKGLLLDEQV
ncbi:MAG: flagellar protein FlaG [Abditibacteriales bacterium]|nr:flagellar protein FlaG [Abditibacteriales bacterium]MDW8365911.1 flagellar protein FlaG [Abditibacteriales bacterium]